MSDIFSSLKISGSGLSVFRRKMNVAAENLANAETTKTKSGGPYKKKEVEISAKGVKQVFSKQLNSASVQLARTNPGHVPGVPIARSNDLKVMHAEATEVTDPNQKFRLVYDPDHPDADEKGFVKMPDINPLMEMVEMMTAARAYEANVTAIKTIKDITRKSLEI
jgi:flagellar basal-body rod protein FlgC